jgi:flagella basal body P-ring formation protein FlgA
MDSLSKYGVPYSSSLADSVRADSIGNVGLSMREWIIHLMVMMLGAILIIAASALAAEQPPRPAPADSRAAGARSASEKIGAEVMARLAAIVPEGVRVDSVMLGCDPAADAALIDVAPGITRLQSRGFVVELRSGGRAIGCSASFSGRRGVLAATHDIAADAPVSAADFRSVLVDAFGLAPGALETMPSQGQYAAVTPIRAGQPVYPTQLARPIAVRPGDLVTVVVHNGPVTLRTQLESRSTAAIGEKATLMNPETGGAVTASVTGEKSAELMMR